MRFTLYLSFLFICCATFQFYAFPYFNFHFSLPFSGGHDYYMKYRVYIKHISLQNVFINIIHSPNKYLLIIPFYAKHCDINMNKINCQPSENLPLTEEGKT